MPEKIPSFQPQLSHTIESALQTFLSHHKEHLPNNLHELAIQAIEKPLLKLIMAHMDYNQSKTATILGLNRATLRKKLIQYNII